MKPSHHITTPRPAYDGTLRALGVSSWSIKDRHGFVLERVRETVLVGPKAARTWAKRHGLPFDPSKWA